MCGQFETLLFYNRLKKLLDMPCVEGEDANAPAKIAPTLGAPIVVENPEHGGLEVIPARFGLVPHWYRGALKDWKATTFNARLDTAAEKPVFKGAWTYRRALIPAEAFYEWSGAKKARRKWRITRGDNHPLVFAGLWDLATLSDGDLWSFTILTRDAGPKMQVIHDREPVVLHPDQWKSWLRRRPVDLLAAAPLRLQCENNVAGSLL